MDAIIVAGGKGTRLGGNVPKALVELKGRPIIARQIDFLNDSGIVDRIILSLGHKSGMVIDYVKASYPDRDIIFSVEDEPLGTGGAVKKAMKLAKSDQVLVLNCDDMTDIDIKKLAGIGENAICVAHPRLIFGLVIEKDGYAIFDEKPELKDWVNCGWYLLDREEMLEVLPDKGSLEIDVFPKIKMRVYRHNGYWRTVNTQKDINEFEASH